MNAQEILAQIERRRQASHDPSAERNAWLTVQYLLTSLTDDTMRSHKQTLVGRSNTQVKLQEMAGPDAQRAALIQVLDEVLGWFEGEQEGQS